MIEEAANRDLFASGARCLVNPVNAAGQPENGLPNAFFQKYPTMLSGYKGMCAQGAMRPGRIWEFQDPATGIWIINIPVKQEAADVTDPKWVDEGLEELARFARRMEIMSIALPAMGCARSGFPFHEFQELVKKHFTKTCKKVIVYAPLPVRAARGRRR